MTFNIYMTGVGGQGIGMLSEVLLRAADYAGYDVKAVDTHGLAQRGGMVVSHLRIGKQVYAPLIPKGEADLAVSLERHEAFRALLHMLKPGGVLIYYDAVWQPLSVRLGQTKTVTESDIRTVADKAGIRIIPVFKPDLPDARMQNIVTLAHIHRNGLIPEITAAHYLQAMTDLMSGGMLEKNRRIFDTA
ncbi:MAG: 2-oxoacid:acceptor oxidoreductase family protein [Desulfatirhabdiaceae bacterium]